MNSQPSPTRFSLGSILFSALFLAPIPSTLLFFALAGYEILADLGAISPRAPYESGWPMFLVLFLISYAAIVAALFLKRRPRNR
jgi:hypothetical protein